VSTPKCTHILATINHKVLHIERCNNLFSVVFYFSQVLSAFASSRRHAMFTACVDVRTTTSRCSTRPTRARSTSLRTRAKQTDSFDAIVRARVDSLIRAHDDSPATQRFVAIAGPPGGGKSTFAEAVRAGYNERRNGEDACVVVPMDGFHFSLAELAAGRAGDADEARKRRGAPWTFDALAFVECVKSLRASGYGEIPTFDHATHDPVEGGCRVERWHETVLIEGNYVLLPERPWRDLADQNVFDETWFVDTDVDEAMQRIIRRHVEVGRSEEEAWERAESNDALNAQLVVQQCRALADVLIPCVSFDR